MTEEIAFKNVVEKIINPNEKIRYQFSLGKRYLKIMKIATIIIGAAILLLIGISLVHLLELNTTIIILIIGGLFILLAGISHFWFGWFLKRSNIYLITDKRILIHKGWLSSNLKSIRHSQITDINVIKPFFDKIIFKTGTLKINTAGSDTYETALCHIENPFEIKLKIIEIRDFSSNQGIQ